jgi:Zn-dependent protease/CBS domain-containing protein
MTADGRPEPGYGSSVTLMHVRTVPVMVGPSLLLLIALFTFWLGRDFSGRAAFDGTVAAWAAALFTSVLFMACVLAHEVGHAVTSLDRGVPVRRITLFLLGGVTESVGEPETARDEFVIVGIGPLISLLLAALAGLAVVALPGGSAAQLVAGYLGWLNAAMAVFNLVPGYPLDGGRLLRSVLWMATSSRHLATRMAARVGQAFALLLLLGAVLSVTGVPDVGPRPVQIALQLLGIMGLWGGLIGIFLLRSSLEAHGYARARERLGRTTAGERMGSVPPTVPADLPLSDAVVRMRERPSVLWPVGRPLRGGVGLQDLDAVPRVRWAGTTVGEIARPDVCVADDTPMDEALDRLQRADARMLLVVRDHEPVGLLTSDLTADVAT